MGKIPAFAGIFFGWCFCIVFCAFVAFVSFVALVSFVGRISGA